MNATCRKCGAHVSEDEAFCPKCGAVMESDMAARTDDASWEIPETFIGKKPPVTKSKAVSPVADAPARITPKASSTPPVRVRAEAEPETQTQPDATNGGSLKFIIGIIVVLIVGALLVLFISRS
ncbi:MAG: zinc-ribbon domain-containing protein [Pyrinomonadaceae bacterium]